MTNELIFLAQTAVVGTATLGALALGAEALVALICAECVLANLFVLKQTTLFGLNATCSDAFTIGATLGLNVLQEYFGRAIARKTIWINFFVLVAYAIFSRIHLLYQPSAFDIMQESYCTILFVMPRIVIASFTVYLIAQSVDYYLYGILKRSTHPWPLVVRNYASMLVSQLVDTVLFTFLGLYGLVENLWQIIVISYTIKVVAILLQTPFVALSRRVYRSLASVQAD